MTSVVDHLAHAMFLDVMIDCHISPLCIFQYTIIGFGFSWFLIKKSIMSESSKYKEWSSLCELWTRSFSGTRSDPRLRVYGPSGSSSYGLLTLCGLKGSDETSSTLALPAIARREVFVFRCLLHFFPLVNHPVQGGIQWRVVWNVVYGWLVTSIP